MAARLAVTLAAVLVSLGLVAMHQLSSHQLARPHNRPAAAAAVAGPALNADLQTSPTAPGGTRGQHDPSCAGRCDHPVMVTTCLPTLTLVLTWTLLPPRIHPLSWWATRRTRPPIPALTGRRPPAFTPVELSVQRT